MRPGSRTHERRRGATLLELLVATAAVSLLVGIAGLIGTTGRGAYTAATTQTAQELRATRALRRVAAELAQAGLDTLTPPPDPVFGSEQIAFQCVTGLAGGEPAWGPIVRIRLEYADGELDDGIDQDGDGLVDEGRLVLVRGEGTPDEQTIVLCRDVAELLEGELDDNDDDNGNGLVDERGFCVSLAGDVLTVRLTTATPTRGGRTVLRTHETSVRIWN